MKVRFFERIKEVEGRLGDTEIILNSFILSWTPYPQLNWGISREDLGKMHVLFMTDDRDRYIDKLFAMGRGEKNEFCCHAHNAQEKRPSV